MVYLQGEIYLSFSNIEVLRGNLTIGLSLELKAASNYDTSQETDLYNLATENAWQIAKQISKPIQDPAFSKELWDLLTELQGKGNGAYIKLIREHLEHLEKS